MPTFQRKTLVQRLGQDWLRDTIVGQTSSSWGSLHLVDVAQANLEFSGEGLHARAYAKLWQSTNTNGVDYRVGSFNAGSGAFVLALPAATTVPSGASYEIHSLLSPAEKGRVIDDTLRRLRVRQEVAIWTIDDVQHYSLGGLDFHNAEDVLNVRYFADPASSLNRDERNLQHWKVRLTGSGSLELRIVPVLAASQQLILDAIVTPTLGSADNATVNLPDDAWLLAGAAAKCYQLLTRGAPGKETRQYREFQAEAAMEFGRLSQRWAPQIDRPIGFDDPLE